MALVAALGISLLVTAGPAWAAAVEPTTMTVTPTTVPVDGQPVTLHVLLVDAHGKGVAEALVRLTVPVDFMGETKNAISAEAVTSLSGRAVLRFAPAASGSVEGTVSYWGDAGYAATEATVRFDIATPAVVYHQEPQGLQAFWARSWVILIPFVAVWLIYLLVATLIVRIRRAGTPTPDPTR